jgi:5-hydroxyisourate hydrolase-like protein (transthyretin family)
MGILAVGLLLFQVQFGSVSGIVTKPGGTEPLQGATVILTPVNSTSSSRIRSVTSEDDGRFNITDIEPGDYRLQVQSTRYASASYGERKPNGPGAILTIAAGQRLSDLKISMAATGTIAGRVIGSSGEPLAYANVQALRYGYRDGKRILSVAQTTTTDDRGDYRLFWLLGGKYVVVAGQRSSPIGTGVVTPIRPGETIRNLLVLPPPGATRAATLDATLEGTNLTKRILEDGTIREESWMPTYYPGTTDRAQAASVDVSAGSVVNGINFTVGPSPVQKIRGRVTNARSQATVSVSSGNQGMIGAAVSTSVSPIDGSFEFAGVLPGSYSLTAQDLTGLVSSPMAVLVGNRDVESLSVALEPPVALSVRLTLEGVAPGTEPLAGLIGTLRPDLDALQGGAPANVRIANIQLGAGNAMTFPNVPPGDYLLDISQNVLREGVKTVYVKSVRLGREDALGRFRLSSDSPRVLDVVLTTESGLLQGVALGRAGDPAANVTVVLVPASARKRMSLYQSVVTSTDGKFRLQGIPPGDYKVFAWDDIETGAWANAEFIRPYESRGQTVRVSENSNEAIVLSVIYNP